MASTELHRGLKQRHLTMIAIGGVIGAGLFVGTGVIIRANGPGAFVTYALGGVLIVMVMRMLGEMAVARPSTGSFSDYSRDALGHWAGFSVAWLYWYFWVIVVGFEAVAGAKILQFWLGDRFALWEISLVLMVLMTATNMFSVRSFGEFEYWFASIKVAAILTFLTCGSLFVLGLWPGSHLDFSNLTAHGGFAPHGGAVLFTGIVTVIFSMVGAEIATIAAAESEDPERAVTRATRSVVVRILIFFIGSVFLLAVILPWNDPNLAASPYVSAFQRIGIPYVDHIMNAVVLTSVLSCLNAGLYTASRMLFVLAGHREAPSAVLKTSSNGVPRVAIGLSTIVGFGCVVAAYISKDGVFAFLLNSSGAVIIFAYIVIAFSQIALRRRAEREGRDLKLKMWLFPWLSWATIVAMVAVLVAMAIDEETRSQVTLGLLSWGLMLAAFWVVTRVRARSDAQAEEAPRPADAPVNRLVVFVTEKAAPAVLRRRVARLADPRGLTALVVVPKNPIHAGLTPDTGAVYLKDATMDEAGQRLRGCVEALREDGHTADGAIGHFSTTEALAEAVADFGPDAVLVVTHPEDRQDWRRHNIDAVARARLQVPVYGVVGTEDGVFAEIVDARSDQSAT